MGWGKTGFGFSLSHKRTKLSGITDSVSYCAFKWPVFAFDLGNLSSRNKYCFTAIYNPIWQGVLKLFFLTFKNLTDFPRILWLFWPTVAPQMKRSIFQERRGNTEMAYWLLIHTTKFISWVGMQTENKTHDGTVSARLGWGIILLVYQNEWKGV